MSAPVPLNSGCCSPPCPDSVQTAVPGPAGENAFSFTTGPFIQPNVGSNVTATLTHNGWVVVGQTVFVQGGGFYVVSSLSGLNVILTNTGNIGNAAVGTTVNVGSQVSPGGVGGNVGNAFTTTNANFNQPAVSSNVTVSVLTSSWAGVGQVVFIPSGGYYTIASIPDGTHLNLTNLGYPGNATLGTPISAPQQVSPGGLQGPAGSAGSITNLTSLPVATTTTKGDLIVDNGANSPNASDVKLAVGTSGQVLAADPVQPLGVGYKTITPNTAVTDGDIAVFSGTVGTPMALKDSKLLISGTGAIQSTPTGGNARGTSAIDLQVTRVSALQVASGTNSGVLAGENNVANATDSFVGGGNTNSATAAQASITGGFGNFASAANAHVGGGANNTASSTNGVVAGGNGNTASGSGGSAIAGGDNNVSSGQDSFVGGGSANQATAQESAVVCGNSNVATSRWATILSGISAKAYLLGQLVHNTGIFAAAGDCQASELMFRAFTTDATPTEMFLDGAAIRAVVPLNTTWSFQGQVLGRMAVGAGGYSGMFGIRGVIRNVAGTVALAGTPIVDTSIEDIPFPNAASVAVSADAGNNSLKIAVTGAAATNIRWGASLRLVEVSF